MLRAATQAVANLCVSDRGATIAFQTCFPELWTTVAHLPDAVMQEAALQALYTCCKHSPARGRRVRFQAHWDLARMFPAQPCTVVRAVSSWLLVLYKNMVAIRCAQAASVVQVVAEGKHALTLSLRLCIFHVHALSPSDAQEATAAHSPPLESTRLYSTAARLFAFLCLELGLLGAMLAAIAYVSCSTAPTLPHGAAEVLPEEHPRSAEAAVSCEETAYLFGLLAHHISESREVLPSTTAEGASAVLLTLMQQLRASLQQLACVVRPVLPLPAAASDADDAQQSEVQPLEAQLGALDVSQGNEKGWPVASSEAESSSGSADGLATQQVASVCDSRTSAACARTLASALEVISEMLTKEDQCACGIDVGSVLAMKHGLASLLPAMLHSLPPLKVGRVPHISANKTVRPFYLLCHQIDRSCYMMS